MGNVIRQALPGYNALTDTDLDHFSLFTDQDNILIKEKARGTFTRATGTETIAHNLGYIPDFKVYVDDQYDPSVKGWKRIPAQQSAVMVAPFWAEADTTNIYVSNNTGVSCNFVYYIFYDNQVGASAQTITESAMVLKVGKAGINILQSKDPNDYIFHSDLNTFKVLKEGIASLTYTADGQYTINHGLSLSNEAAFDYFIKFPDGYTVHGVGAGTVYSRDHNFLAWNAIITTTQIKLNLTRDGGAGTALTVKYYIYETPLTGASGISIVQNDHWLRVAKSGYNALNETDPNNYRFLSGYNTLKYLPSGAGNQSITIVGDTTDKSTEVTVAHNLGYVPYHVCFVDDFDNFPDERFSLAPYKNSTLTINRRAEVYADTTNLYLKMFNQSANTYTGKFYYKIYKNSLGL